MEDYVKDFFEWANTIPVPETKYFAVFNEHGEILGIYSEHSCQTIPNKIEIDTEIALSVIEGTTNLNSYIVDIDSETIEFVEIKSLKKIDDVIHRVVDKQWSSIDSPDVSLIYDRNKSLLKIKLNEKFKTKKILWNGSTDMQFVITDYNDPNIFYNTFSFTINDIMKNELEFNISLPKIYSIYTRRLFKNYVIEEI